MRFAASVVFILLVMACLSSGCARRHTEQAPADEIVRSFEAPDAPLTVHVSIDRREISIADSFRCRIEIEHATTLDVALPPFAELEASFAPLLARDRRVVPSRIEGDSMIEGDEYMLEPLVSGPVTIRSLTIPYMVDGETRTIITEPIELTVVSLGADDPRAELRDIAGPVELPSTRRPWWLWVVLGGGVVVATAVVLILTRRRPPTPRTERLRAAHEIAFDALRALREKDYIGRDLIPQFYVELSAILRWYIENRFGLHAPEQTTDEFIAAISTNGFFDLRRRTLLREFLGHCDLVKFARYGPSAHEISSAFDTTATFIDETAERNSAEWTPPENVSETVGVS